MRRLIQTTVLCLCLALTTPARADIVYQGRDAQGLQCAATMIVISAQLSVLGLISDKTVNQSAHLAAYILTQLPGTEAQKLQALRQRSDRLSKTRNPKQMLDEFGKTERWCRREFLSQ